MCNGNKGVGGRQGKKWKRAKADNAINSFEKNFYHVR